jgi:hypothetical protein
VLPLWLLLWLLPGPVADSESGPVIVVRVWVVVVPVRVARLPAATI